MKGFQQIKPLTEFRIVCPHGLNHGQGEDLTSEFADGCSNGLNHSQNIGLSQHYVKRFQQIKTLTEFCIMCPHGLNQGQGEG